LRKDPLLASGRGTPRRGLRMQREWLQAMREAGVPRQYWLRVQERLVVLEFALR
jgi:hypothetical protein